MVEQLGLRTITGRHWSLHLTSATKPANATGLPEALRWYIESMALPLPPSSPTLLPPVNGRTLPPTAVVCDDDDGEHENEVETSLPKTPPEGVCPAASARCRFRQDEVALQDIEEDDTWSDVHGRGAHGCGGSDGLRTLQVLTPRTGAPKVLTDRQKDDDEAAWRAPAARRLSPSRTARVAPVLELASAAPPAASTPDVETPRTRTMAWEDDGVDFVFLHGHT
eukprot:4358877-Prymnesium_polylepis.1